MNRHIWKNMIDRNRFKKRIFFKPNYSNIIIDQHLMLSKNNMNYEEDEDNSFNLSQMNIL